MKVGTRVKQFKGNCWLYGKIVGFDKQTPRVLFDNPYEGERSVPERFLHHADDENIASR